MSFLIHSMRAVRYQSPPPQARKFATFAPFQRRFTWIRGSVIHVPLHFGHFDGFLSLSVPNSNPHFLHVAGSISASYSMCFRLLSRCSRSSVVSFPFWSAIREISVTVNGRLSR